MAGCRPRRTLTSFGTRVRYPDVARAIRAGTIQDAKQHYARWGYREGRFPCDGHRAAMYDAHAKPTPTLHQEAVLVPDAIEAERKPRLASILDLKSA